MKSYLVDANLMVLLVVGSFDRRLVGRHKRCREFDPTDFDILSGLLETKAVVCTPHALAEASNLIRLTGEPQKSSLSAHFADVIGRIAEDLIASRDAVSADAYVRLGLTDASLLSTSKDYELLTTDYDLYVQALSQGRAVTNFTHLRERIAPR